MQQYLRSIYAQPCQLATRQQSRREFIWWRLFRSGCTVPESRSTCTIACLVNFFLYLARYGMFHLTLQGDKEWLPVLWFGGLVAWLTLSIAGFVIFVVLQQHDRLTLKTFSFLCVCVQYYVVRVYSSECTLVSDLLPVLTNALLCSSNGISNIGIGCVSCGGAVIIPLCLGPHCTRL